MPPDPKVTNEVAHELNLRDLGDISALKRFEPFERYWMRCLRQKREAKHEDFLHGKVTKDEREELRQQVLLLDEILAMPADHEASIRRELPNGVDLESPN